MYAAQLVTRVAIEGDVETKARLDSVGKKVDDTSKGFRDKLGHDLKLGMMAAGASIVALGVSATKLAGDYNAGLTTLVTGAGELPKNLSMVHDKMLQISTDTGTMTQDLVAGEFLINSAGQKGTQALTTLADSARGAKVGAASLADVANGVTTEMTDYAKAHLTSAQATNTLIAATADGKTHLGELSVAMAAVLPTSAAVGVGLYDVAGAMSTMTGEGTPAADAATYLRQMLLALEVPGSKAVKTFKEIGLTSAQIAAEMKISLPATLQLITDHLSKKFPPGSAAYVDALKNMAGGQKNFQAWLELTGQHLTDFSANVQDITKKVKDGGNSIVGWTEVQKDFNFQLDQAHASFNAVLIKVGEQLMPMLSTFLHDVVMPAITHFSDWATHTTNLHDAFQTVVDVLGTTVGVVQTVVTWFSQGGTQTNLLKDALLDVGIAVGLIKFADLANNIMNITTVVIPQALIKFGLMSAAAKDVAVQEALIGPAAVTSEATVETVVPAFEAAFGRVGTAALGAAGEGGIAAVGTAATDAAPLVIAGFNSMLGPIGAVALAAWGAYQMISAVPPMPTTTTVTTNTGPNGSPVQTTVANPNNIGAVRTQGIDTIMDTKTSSQKLAQQFADAQKAWQDFQAAEIKRLQSDYQNYLVTQQRDQLVSDTLRRQQHLKSQNDVYNDTKLYYDEQAKLAVSKSADGVATQQKWDTYSRTVLIANINDTIVAQFNAQQTAQKNQKINDTLLTQSHKAYMDTMYNDTVTTYNDMNAVANQKAIEATKNQKINDALLLAAYNEGLGYMVDSTGKYYGLMVQEANAKSQQMPTPTPTPPHPIGTGSGPTRTPGFASGVTNFAGGLARVHRDELLTYLPTGTNVTPANQMNWQGGGRPQPINITLMCDGYTLARIMTEHQAGILRSGLGIIGI